MHNTTKTFKRSHPHINPIHTLQQLGQNFDKSSFSARPTIKYSESKIFPLDYYDDNGFTDKSKGMGCCGLKKEAYESYFSKRIKKSNDQGCRNTVETLETLVPLQPHQKNKKRTRSYTITKGISLSSTLCNKIPNNSLTIPVLQLQTNSHKCQTPYLQRKISTARDRFHIKKATPKIGAPLSSRSIMTRPESNNQFDIQIAHSIKIHDLGQQVQHAVGNLCRSHKSSQSRNRNRVQGMNGVKFGGKVDSAAVKNTKKDKDYLRPWSGVGGLGGFFPGNQGFNGIFMEK